MVRNNEYMVEIVKECDVSALLELFRAGGWWKEEWDPAHIPDLVKASFAFAIAKHITDGVIVGMGRVISDGISDAYIQDLVILPEYRGMGIGGSIVRILLHYCINNNITWIALIAEPGTEEFYRPLGFNPMDQYVPMLFSGGST